MCPILQTDRITTVVGLPNPRYKIGQLAYGLFFTKQTRWYDMYVFLKEMTHPERIVPWFIEWNADGTKNPSVKAM